MQAIEFPQQTFVLAKDQPQYNPLPVHAKIEEIHYKDENGKALVKETVTELTACFKLSPEEIAQVIATGELWYTQCVWGAQFQPIRMSVLNPFVEAQEAPAQSPITALVHALNTDEAYREGWRANLAAAFVNAGQWLNISETSLKEVGALAARNFLVQLCNNKAL